MTFLNPKDFIITRKRKLYKFALFNNSSICFEFDEWKKDETHNLEIGAGTGLFSEALAAQNPSKKFVAVDVKADRLVKGAQQAELDGLNNIRFLRARADQLLQAFAPHSVKYLWVTFPDPFPRNRNAGRRLTHPTFLRLYAEPEQDGAKRVTIHKESAVQMIAITYHIPNFEHEDQVALSALSELLSNGKSSILQKKLVDEKRLVNTIYAYNMDLKDPGLFMFMGQQRDGTRKN
jgi:tRNA G46 methylase TrmB